MFSEKLLRFNVDITIKECFFVFFFFRVARWCALGDHYAGRTTTGALNPASRTETVFTGERNRPSTERVDGRAGARQTARVPRNEHAHMGRIGRTACPVHVLSVRPSDSDGGSIATQAAVEDLLPLLLYTTIRDARVSLVRRARAYIINVFQESRRLIFGRYRVLKKEKHIICYKEGRI